MTIAKPTRPPTGEPLTGVSLPSRSTAITAIFELPRPPTSRYRGAAIAATAKMLSVLPSTNASAVERCLCITPLKALSPNAKAHGLETMAYSCAGRTEEIPTHGDAQPSLESENCDDAGQRRDRDAARATRDPSTRRDRHMDLRARRPADLLDPVLYVRLLPA